MRGTPQGVVLVLLKKLLVNPDTQGIKMVYNADDVAMLCGESNYVGRSNEIRFFGHKLYAYIESGENWADALYK